MKYLFTISIFLLLKLSSSAQCYSVAYTGYVRTTLPSPIHPAIGQDLFSAKFAIGFPFCFYGASYDSLLIGENGIISFNTSLANSTCQWPIVAALPSTSMPLNAIFFPMQDLNYQLGGNIAFQTLGIAPNRVFIVDFDSVPMYACPSSHFSGQVKLFEGSNAIEFDLTDKATCIQWNGGTAVEGIQNSLGNYATIVSGRNYPVQWTALNDSHIFNPTCNVCSGVGIAESIMEGFNLFVNEQNQISIIPNGTEYKLVSINNLLGQNIQFTQTENTISLQHPASGIYFVNLEVNGTRISKKIILQ